MAEFRLLTHGQAQEDVLLLLRSISVARDRLKEAESRRVASEAAAALLAAEMEALKAEASSKLAAVQGDEARLMGSIAADDISMGLGLERLRDSASWLESTMDEVNPRITRGWLSLHESISNKAIQHRPDLYVDNTCVRCTPSRGVDASFRLGTVDL